MTQTLVLTFVHIPLERIVQALALFCINVSAIITRMLVTENIL